MITSDLGQRYDRLHDDDKAVILALSVLANRIRGLPKVDREDLFELLTEWNASSDPEDQSSIRQAMEEILAQVPVRSKPMELAPTKLGKKTAKWAVHVGRKIKELREARGWTQGELAERASLQQSHVSRLENAEYSATNMTIEKIAKAFDVPAGEIDPCVLKP